MKAVLMSIRPEWCGRISCGKKTIELRKTKPKQATPFKCYIYCTLGGSQIYLKNGSKGNGKVIGEFVCDRIECLDMDSVGVGFWENDNFNYIADLGWNTGLTLGEFINYSEGKQIYGWHISNHKIYDAPNNLQIFSKYWDYDNDIRPCETCELYQFDYGENMMVCGYDFDGENCPKMKLKRPPQSWCYVEEVMK